MKTLSLERVKLFFYIFISLHLLIWTLLPTTVRYNLPLDSIEGTIWGQHLQWGYDKNPFLNGWLTAFASYLSQPSGWMIYLFSQLSVIISFWAVWKLARKMLPAVYALLAVMVLEGIQYYNFHAIDFNDNTLELSLWALTSYFFYCAVTKGRIKDWLCVAFFAGLGMMAKYYTLALLAGMALFLLANAENRKQLATLPPYLGLLLFIVFILPHVIWLFFHDFITINYMLQRASHTPDWSNHIVQPLNFAWQQLQAFLPAIGLALILFLGKKHADVPAGISLNREQPHLTPFNKSFLFYVGLGPFLLTLLLSFILGIRLRAGWGMPLQSLWGIILIASLRPALSKQRLIIFFTVFYSLLASLAIGYIISLVSSPDPSSANFPGKELAQTITQEWRDNYHTPLPYVAGSRWISGNIEFYSSDHPAVLIEWDHQKSPWINLEDLKKKGGVFVWNISNNETLPPEIANQFKLAQTRILSFSWYRNKYHLPDIKIAVAVLPPQQSSS